MCSGYLSGLSRHLQKRPNSNQSQGQSLADIRVLSHRANLHHHVTRRNPFRANGLHVEETTSAGGRIFGEFARAKVAKREEGKKSVLITRRCH